MLTSLALALALALAFGPRLQTPITLDVQNDTLPNVMSQISERTGVPIKVIGGPERDWVCVSFKERSAESILDSLAVICRAEWEQIEGEIIFRAPWPPKDSLQPKRQADIAAWLKKHPAPSTLSAEAAKKLIFDIRSLSRQPNGLQSAYPLLQQTPIPRAHLRLIHAIGAERLSQIPEQEERTFLLEAENRAERFPASARQILSDFTAERRLYGDAISSLGLSGDELGGYDWRPAYAYYLDPEADERLWCVTVRNTGHYLYSTFRGFGGRDRFYEKVTDELEIPLDGLEPENQITNAGVKGVFNAPSIWRQEPGERLAEMGRMDEQEMLTSRMHEVYRLWAEETKTDIAAIIPDGAYIRATYGRTSYNLAIVINQSFLGVDYRLRDGVSLFTSLDLDATRKTRIPRKEAAAFARHLAESEDTTLEAAASLAVACQWTESYRNALEFIKSDLWSREISFTDDAPLLRLYGRLTDSQQKVAKGDGLLLTYGTLSRGQKEDVEEMLRLDGAGLDIRRALPDLDSNTEYERDFFALIAPNLPAQISAATPVLIRMNDLQKYFAIRYADGEPFVGEVTAKDVAYFKVYAPESWGRVDRYFVGNQSFLQAALDFGPAGRFARTARSRTPQSEPVPMEQMPPAFQEDFRRHLDQYRRAKGDG